MTESLSIPSFLTITKERKPLGDVLLDMQRAFPEFNFYYDKPANMSTNHYLLERKPVPFQLYFEYGQVKRWFLNVISHAQQMAWDGKTDEAIHWYQTLIEHRYPNYKPYDLLNGIYRKQKDLEAQKRHLNYSAEFFTELRESQKKYVLSLASKYNSHDRALEYINRGDKIHYYGGAFVLYDPVKVLEKWEGVKQ
jgi:hypothetical protein